MKFLLLSALVFYCSPAFGGMVGILPSRNNSNLAANSTGYVQLHSCGNLSYNATESQVTQVMPIAGSFSYLRVRCTDPGGSGQSRAFTLMKNGVATALTATVNTGSTLASDTVDSVSVVAGDTVTLKQVVSVTAAASGSTWWVTKFTADNVQEYPLLATDSSQMSAGTTYYFAIQGDGGASATINRRKSYFPTAGTLSNLYFLLDASPGAGKNVVVTVHKNGVATALTATINGTNTSANDTVNTVSVVSGDDITYEVSLDAAANPSRPRFGMKFAPTVDGESVVFTSSGSTVAQNLTTYNGPAGGANSWTSEAQRQVFMIGSTMRKLYVSVMDVASGQTFATMLRKNTANTTTTCTVTGVSTTCSDTSNDSSVADDDLVAIRGITSVTSGTVRPAISFVLYIIPASIPNQNPKRAVTGVGL